MKLFKRSRSTKAEHHQQEQKAVRSTSGPLHEKHRAEEYVYVPSRFGYDYAPPSLLAPSHSVDNSTVQQHLSKMLYEQEPVSELSGNTASMSSYYKKEAEDAVRQHQEYETKYQQKTPQVSNNSALRRHQEYETKYRKKTTQVSNKGIQAMGSSSRIQKPGGSSKSHWRPSKQEERQRSSEQQKMERAEKFQRGPPPPPRDSEEREQAPHPYHHRSMSEESRQTVERVPALRDVPSIDSGLHYIRERSRQSRYSTGDSVASSHLSNNQRRQQPQGIPQQSGPSNQLSQARRHYSEGVPQQPAPGSLPSNERRRQPIQPRIPPSQGLVASHSIDASTITTLPETFGKAVEQEGTYYRQHEARRNAMASGRPRMHHQPQNLNDAGSQVSAARERKRNIEQSYKDYLVQKKGWVPTAFVAAEEAAQNKTAAPSANSAPSNVATSNEPKRAPIAPVVPPKKKGLLKRLFGRRKSKNEILENAKQKQTQASSTGSKKQVPRIQVDPPSKGSIRGVVNPAKSGKPAPAQAKSNSTDIESSTKMYCQPVSSIPKDNDTPMSMVAARSIASSHKKYGIQFNASAQSKTSSSVQQQQSTTSSTNRSTVSNKIFFPETAAAGSTGNVSSRHSADVSTKFYSGGGTTLQSRHSSHGGGSVGSRVNTAQSSSVDRRRVPVGSLGSSRPSNGSSSSYAATSYSRAVTNSILTSSMLSNSMASSQSSQRSSGSRISGQVSRSASQPGLQTKRSGETDWKPDPRMPDPWVKPQVKQPVRQRAIIRGKHDPRILDPYVKRPRGDVIIRGTHRANSSRRPYTEGSPTTLASLLNFSCI